VSEPTPEQQHWTAKFQRPIIFIILTMVGAGTYLAFQIPVSVFPATDFPRIVVGIDNNVAPIDQMQVMVTRPIEEAMNSVPGLNSVRSVTSRGSAEVSLFFNWNINMFQTLQSVNSALARVQPDLPVTAKLTTNKLTFAAFPIIGYSLTSSKIPQTKLWELATYTMKPRLNRVNGVSMVVVQGGQEPEFHIEPDPAKLTQTQITIPNILEAVAKSNLIDSPGMIEHNHQLVLGLVSGQTRSLEEISNVVIKTTPAGLPVRIADIGEVKNSVKPVYTAVTADGKQAVLLNVFRQPDSNTVKVADEIRAEIQVLTKELPDEVKIKAFYDQSEIVRESIASVRDAILIGLLLAAIILVLFLRDWGSSIVAGLVIPATLGITMIVMRWLGESFNLMTLGGLAAAVGLVIDDAIVVVENIVMHRDSGQDRSEAIFSALKEIRVPLVGSTVTPIVVFLPLITMTGVEGTFFRALAITVGVALLTSLFLALTWTPALSYSLLRSKSHGGKGEHEGIATTGLMGKLTQFYSKVLRGTLAYPVVLPVLCAGLVVGSYFCYKSLGTDLLPAMDEGGFILDYLTPPGASLEETNRVLLGVEKILNETPEVESNSRRTGLQLGLAAVTESNRGDFSVKLKKKRDRAVDEVISDIRGKINKRYPALDVEFPQVLQDMIGDLTNSPEPVEVKLFSQNPELLKLWAPRVGMAVKATKGVTDVKNGIENTISGPAMVFRVDQAIAARSGFTPQEIETDASAIFQGEPAPAPVVVNDRPYTLRVRFPESTRASLDAIKGTVLTSSTGRTATLGTLATFEDEAGQTEIRRENLQRVVAVTGRLEGVSLGEGVDAVKKSVDTVHLPAGIRVEYGGTYEEQQKSFKELEIVLAMAVLLVFIVLLVEFGEFGAPIAILASCLLSTSGVFLALLVTKTTFNISSFMGLIMVIGIVAKNGILLLDADQKFRRQGMTAQDAMIEAGERRLRPILMTAMATVAGMIPLSLAIGAGSQMLQPLAIAVIGGIAASMVLSLVVTPAVHYFLGPKHSEAA
jgi:CzcA family heavy metal efflux pump